MRFTWHESKRRANLPKHGLDFPDAAKGFDGPMVLFEDQRFDYGGQFVYDFLIDTRAASAQGALHGVCNRR